MTRDEAIGIRRELLQRAQVAGWLASDKNAFWGDRYKAVVTRDHCLELVEECEIYIRKLAGAK